MLCPVCKIEMRQTDLGEYGFIVLDVCPTCSGAWFDEDELNRLDGSVWTNIEEHAFHEVEGDHQNANCPKCEVPLKPLSSPDVPDLIVDQCADCNGFWLDKGELDRMVNLADEEDGKIMKKIEITQKPLDWSHMKWTIHCFKRTYFN